MTGATRGEGVTLAIDGKPLGTVLRADLPGRFLRRHPLRRASLAQPGARLRAGEPLGLLAVGEILVTVTMPEDGVLLSFLAADGDAVGHGGALAGYVSLAELAALEIMP